MNVPRLLRFGGLGLLMGLLVFVLSMYTPLHQVSETFEARAYDLRARLTAHPERVIEDVVVVDIDSRSIQELGRFQQWSRSYYVRLLDVLQRGEAAAVAFDLLFDPYIDPFADSTFAAAIEDNGRVGIAIDFAPSDSTNFLYAMDGPPAGFNADRRSVQLSGDPVCAWSRERMEVGVPGLANRAWFVGFVNAQHDPDGVIRRAPLLMEFAGQYYPSLSFGLAAHLYGWDLDRIEGNADEIVTYDSTGNVARQIALDGEGRMLINYRGPFQSFRYISMYDVIEERIPPAFFKDKVVFVGASYAGLADLKPVPVQSVFAGVEIHASAFHNLMMGDPVKVSPPWVTLIITLLMGMITGMAMGSLRVSHVVVILLVLVLGYLGFTVYMFSSHDTEMQAVMPISSLILAGIAASTYKYVVEEKDKRFLRSAFSHYVSDSVVSELVQNPDMLRLGGERRTLTMMFSDIRSFTTISEQLDPEKLGQLLNNYLSEMTNIIFAAGGTLDKYIGDAVVAFFGAPIPHENHAPRAIRAAILMQKRIASLRQTESYKGTPFEQIHAGIGIHTGPVMVGNFGSDQRFDYTAIGDSMNLASRLEGLTKYYRCSILCSDDTVNQLDDEFVVRQLDRVRVKGKNEPVILFEVMGFKGEDERSGDFYSSFEHALELYLKGQFSKAVAAFDEHVKKYPDDGPATMMLERNLDLVKLPPSDWEGAWNMLSK